MDIPKEQLSASRAKSKSFFFTASEQQAEEPTDARDRTIKINVATEAQRDEPDAELNPRLAEQTFWDSYRKEEDEEEAGFADPELMEEYRKLMSGVKDDVDEDEDEDEDEEPLPSTDIDDLLELERPRPVAVTRNALQAEERKKKRQKVR